MNEGLSASDVTEDSHSPNPLNRCWLSTTNDFFAAFNAPPLFFRFNIRIYCAIEIEPIFPVRAGLDRSSLGRSAFGLELSLAL
jgi:hypothetical protein